MNKRDSLSDTLHPHGTSVRHDMVGGAATGAGLQRGEPPGIGGGPVDDLH